jgi:PadR family transcriptional regulator PadR
MDEPRWPTDWVRVALPGVVLAIVRGEESYGYLIAQRLSAAGFGEVKGSVLYPLLARLEQDGALASTWREGAGGPGRKYYTLTAVGHERLEEYRTAWVRFSDSTTALLTSTRDEQ